MHEDGGKGIGDNGNGDDDDDEKYGLLGEVISPLPWRLIIIQIIAMKFYKTNTSLTNNPFTSSLSILIWVIALFLSTIATGGNTWQTTFPTGTYV